MGAREKVSLGRTSVEIEIFEIACLVVLLSLSNALAPLFFVDSNIFTDTVTVSRALKKVTNDSRKMVESCYHDNL